MVGSINNHPFSNLPGALFELREALFEPLGSAFRTSGKCFSNFREVLSRHFLQLRLWSTATGTAATATATSKSNSRKFKKCFPGGKKGYWGVRKGLPGKQKVPSRESKSGAEEVINISDRIATKRYDQLFSILATPRI